MKRRRLLAGILACIVLAILVIVVPVELKTPSNNRVWAPDFSRLVDITQENGTYAFHNVRDFTYEGTSTPHQRWIDMRIDPTQITGAWFVLDLFSPIKQIGHTFIVFDLADGRSIGFSIEARKEKDERYSFIGGFLRDYELEYLWATERDLIPERIVYLEEPIQMYRLTIPKEAAQALFRSFVEETQNVNAHPRFYNTFTANCTDLLAKITNKYYPGTLPYDISWNLTGLSVKYLTSRGYIAATDTPDKADLTRYHDEMMAHASDTPSEFTALIRSFLSR